MSLMEIHALSLFPIPEETYKFYGPDGNVCIHMRAGLEVKVNYTTENGVCGYVGMCVRKKSY